MPIVSGKEIRVNTFLGYQHDPAAVALPDGGMVVTWTSDWQDGSGSGVYQQVFNADGSARGGERQVHTITANNQFDTKLNLLNDGGWVVTWRAVNDNGGTDIYQRMYNANGSARDSGRLISNEGGIEYPYDRTEKDNYDVVVMPDGNIITTWDSQRSGSDHIIQYAINYIKSSQYSFSSRVDGFYHEVYDPDIAVLNDGTRVVTWTSYGQSYPQSQHINEAYGEEIYLAIINPRGVIFIEQNVNSFHSGNQTNSEVIALPKGGYLIAWESELQDGSGYGIYQKIVGGSSPSGEIRVNTYVNGDQLGKKISLLPDGGWIVAWTSQGQDGSGTGIYQKVFKSDGTVRFAESRVTTTTKGNQVEPQIAVLKDGGWVIAWQSDRANGTGFDIFMQAYNSNGGKAGNEILVSSSKSSYNHPPMVTPLKNGGWSITWEASVQDGMGGLTTNIYQKFFQKTGAPVISGGDAVAVKIVENNSFVKTLKATDPEKKSMAWSIDGGDDAGLFTIDSKTGALSFKAKANFDVPIDRNKDGIYSVVVKVSDAELQIDKQTVKVTLTDVPGKTLLGDSKANTYGGTAENDFISGAGGNDTLRGYGDTDRLFGGSGADRIYGGSGNDWIDGGIGNDLLYGDSGNDIITGFDGDDQIDGSSGNDELYGNNGNDTLNAGAGNDIVYGNDGNDILAGGDGSDSIYGGKGIDGIDGGAGNDYLRGGEGNDGITGGNGSDMVWGEAGADILFGGLGKDTLYGGSGSDVFVLEIPKSERYTWNEIDTIADFQPGSDKIDLSGLSWVKSKYGLEFKVIAMNIKNEYGGITLAGGFRVFYDGDPIVEVKASSLKYSDFIL